MTNPQQLDDDEQFLHWFDSVTDSQAVEMIKRGVYAEHCTRAWIIRGLVPSTAEERATQRWHRGSSD